MPGRWFRKTLPLILAISWVPQRHIGDDIATLHVSERFKERAN